MTVIPAAASGFIRDGRVGRLGTADRSGQPMVVPICYAFDGAHLFSPVDAKPKSAAPAALRRIRNIQDNPRVSVVIDRYEEDWSRLEWVMIQGEADLLTGGDDFARGVALLRDKYPQYRAMGLAADRGLMIRVRPGRVRHWRAAAGGDAPAGAAS
jgi:PPOX class probable F420-dependent enzyme